MQENTQIRQTTETARVFQPCQCIQSILASKRSQVRSTIVWGIIALFSILLLDLLSLWTEYQDFDKRVLFMYIVKLSLLVGFLIVWYSKKYQRMAKKYKKAMLFTYSLSLSITMIEEMLIKQEQFDKRNILIIGIIQICITLAIFQQIMDENKLSMICQVIITCYVLARLFEYANISAQSIVFSVIQYFILASFSITHFYLQKSYKGIQAKPCHLTKQALSQQQQQQQQQQIQQQQQQLQSQIKNNESMQYQNEQQQQQQQIYHPLQQINLNRSSSGKNISYSNINNFNHSTYLNHTNNHLLDKQPNHNHTILDQYQLKDHESKNKGLSFSFDVSSQEPGTPIQQINNNNNNNAGLLQYALKSPLNLSLQYEKESELAQKSTTNNSQKIQNLRYNLENSQGNLMNGGSLNREGSFFNESGNFLKVSGQNCGNNDNYFPNNQWNGQSNDSINQSGKIKIKAPPIGPSRGNSQNQGSPSSHGQCYNYQTILSKLSGLNNQVESSKNISLAQLELTQSKKMSNGKSAHAETVNLVNFYNMFFNILPEGIAIIPLTSFPDRFDGCQINQTLSSLLECDNKEKCIEFLSELRNSKLDEQQLNLMQSKQLNLNNSNQSGMQYGSNIDSISQMKTDSVISTLSAANIQQETVKSRKKTTGRPTIISSQSLKEEVPTIFQDSQSQEDQNRENYINEKTRRITFVVDYNNIKKNKNIESISEIIHHERKPSFTNDMRSNRFYSTNQDSMRNNQKATEQSNLQGIPLLKPSNYQVEVNPSTKLSVMKEIEHIRKQLQSLKFVDNYEMIGVHVRMVSKCKLENEKTKYFEIIFIPCIIKSEITVVLVVKDITHFNEIEVLKMVNDNKSQMLSQVAHEIRTPLNCVISMIEITKDLTDQQICENYLAPALTSARLLNNLIQDLLDMAQVKAGCFQLKSTKFNIRSLLEEVRQLMKIQAQSSNIQMQIECEDVVPLFIFSDPFRIRQILINLIGNALKFTQKGFITVVVDRYLHQNIETVIKISVKDTGIGIKPKQKQKLFQAFGKLDDDNQENLNPKGVGLGLMISNELAKKLSHPVFINQGLEVASIYGQGSEFSFYIIDNVQLQASVIQISQKQIQGIDSKTDKSFKKRMNSSSLHRIDEEERENKSLNEIKIENQAQSNPPQQIINKIHDQQQYGSYVNYFGQSNPSNLNINTSPQVQKQSHQAYSHRQVSTERSFNQNTTYNTNNQRGNTSLNSFDHNIEDEESAPQPVNGYLSLKLNNLDFNQLNATPIKNQQKPFSYSPTHSDVSTTNHDQNREEEEDLKNPGLYQFQSLSLQSASQFSNPSSPTKQTTKSNPNQNAQQAKKNSISKNVFSAIQGYEDLEYQFGNVVNPLLETRELSSMKTQNDEQITMKNKKEKQQNCNCNKILIVDDNTFNVYALKQLIKALKQYECDSALSGELAIQCIQQKLHMKCCQKYKIIFMDIDMPSQSGLETTAYIRKNFYNLKDTKIIGCSGYSNSSQEYEECKDVGMNDYISKPIDKNYLKQILETYMV